MEPLDFEAEDQFAISPVLPKKRRKVIISLDDLLNGHYEEERKGKEKESKKAKKRKISNSDDDDDDDQSKKEVELSEAVDGCQQKIDEIGGEDDYPVWGVPIFGNQKTPLPAASTELGHCKILDAFMKNKLNSFVSLTMEKGETFIQGLLVNRWLFKMVFISGRVEKSIASWTFNFILYSSDEELRTVACEFWCGILSSKKKIIIDWLPSYLELKGALEVYGSLLDSPTLSTSSQSAETDSDHGWLPQNIRGWIKFIAVSFRVRNLYSIFSTSEAELLLQALICFSLDRKLQGLSMLMHECVQLAIGFFRDDEWQHSCKKVAKLIACRVPRDLNCLRIVESISGINTRSKQLKSAISYEFIVMCLDNKVTGSKEILQHLSSMSMKDKSCDLFKMYICLTLIENWLLAAQMLENYSEIYNDWDTFLRNCSCQINTRDLRSYASKVRSKASYLLQTIAKK